ncbi:MAG: hypothetical protein ACXV8Q_00675 [Methylobacter sp.]
MSNVKSAVSAVFEQVGHVFSSALKKEVKVTCINPDALTAWQQSWDSVNQRTPPDGGWDWQYKLYEASKKYSKRLVSIAVWSDNSCLCGLAICSKSRGNRVLSLHYLEGSPVEQHPLSGYVFQIIDSTLQEYGYLINANDIRIMQPVDNLISHYNFYGYILNKKTLFGRPYCVKGLER